MLYTITYTVKEVTYVRNWSCEAALIKCYDYLPKDACDITFYHNGRFLRPSWAD